MTIKGICNYSCEVKKSHIHGKGTFSNTTIPKKRKIGHLPGDVVSVRKARAKAKNRKSISVVELWNGKALDCIDKKNELSYINHSCDPNCYMRCLGNYVEVYSLFPIKKGEELSCDYGATHHDGMILCRCGSKNCKSYL